MRDQDLGSSLFFTSFIKHSSTLSFCNILSHFSPVSLAAPFSNSLMGPHFPPSVFNYWYYS